MQSMHIIYHLVVLLSSDISLFQPLPAERLILNAPLVEAYSECVRGLSCGSPWGGREPLATLVREIV